MKHFLTILVAALLVVALVFSFGVGKTAKYTKDAWLGVETQTVDDELAKGFDLPVKHGAIVNDVIDGSPADEIGLEQGDIIVALDGNKVLDSDDLIDMIEDHNPQDKVTLKIYREGKEKDIEVTLDRAPKNRRDVIVIPRGSSRGHSLLAPAAPAAPAVPDVPKVYGVWNNNGNQGKWYSVTSDKGGYLGVSILDLGDQLGDYFGVKDGDGALVTSVVEDSPAAEAGIKAGDVIVKIGDSEIDGTEDVYDAMDDYEKGDKVDVQVVRDKHEQSLAVTIGENKDNSYSYSYHFNGPDMNIRVPKMKGILNGSYSNLDEYLNSDEFKDQMEQLKDQISELKEDFRTKQRDQAQQLRDQLQELRDQLQEIERKMK
ncbi:MAG TPA: PDZ domain-containing protein [candidate division Zixibacteria bacterium]|nr:PDZ domain-containing protein [candidate division Zixibacteria bacterium]